MGIGDCALGTDEWANFLNYGIGTIALFPWIPAAPGKLWNLIPKRPGNMSYVTIHLIHHRDLLYQPSFDNIWQFVWSIKWKSSYKCMIYEQVTNIHSCKYNSFKYHITFSDNKLDSNSSHLIVKQMHPRSWYQW